MNPFQASKAVIMKGSIGFVDYRMSKNQVGHAYEAHCFLFHFPIFVH